MEKEEFKNKEQNNTEEVIKEKSEIKNSEEKEEKKQKTPEEKIKDLEDKVTRIYADMENQRRRYEKEKEEAFEFHRPKMLGMVPLLYSRKNLHALLKNDLIPVALF